MNAQPADGEEGIIENNDMPVPLNFDYEAAALAVEVTSFLTPRTVFAQLATASAHKRIVASDARREGFMACLPQ